MDPAKRAKIEAARKAKAEKAAAKVGGWVGVFGVGGLGEGGWVGSIDCLADVFVFPTPTAPPPNNPAPNQQPTNPTAQRTEGRRRPRRPRRGEARWGWGWGCGSSRSGSRPASSSSRGAGVVAMVVGMAE